jgi:hypothetical protein
MSACALCSSPLTPRLGVECVHPGYGRPKRRLVCVNPACRAGVWFADAPIGSGPGQEGGIGNGRASSALRRGSGGAAIVAMHRRRSGRAL